MLHRDLKPQNILINSALGIRICDLGLARTSQEQDGLATGYVTTRWYRAPEVMLTWQHYTNALDMYGMMISYLCFQFASPLPPLSSTALLLVSTVAVSPSFLGVCSILTSLCY